jgi:alkaline phosphatase
VLSLLAFFSFFLGFLFALPSRMKNKPVNVIMMISDGFGPASLARNCYQYSNKLDFGSILPLDTILVGSSRTRSYSSLVTDSAAGATAFSCALMSYNAATGVGPDRKPCGTVLEAAKETSGVGGYFAYNSW